MRRQIQGAPSAMKRHLVSGVEADLPRVRQQQGEDRLRSPERAVDDRGPRLRRSPVVADDVQDEELRFLPVGMESVAPLLRLGATLLAPHADAAPVEGDDHPLAGHAVQQTARRALLGRSGPRSVAIGGRAEGLDIQGDAVGAELRLRFGQRAEHGDRAACIRGQLRRAPVVDAQHHQGGVESRPPLRPTGVFLAVVRRRDRHRRAPGGANVDGLEAVAPHPPGQVAHEGARRVANRGRAHRALQHGGEEGAEELVRDDPQLLFALLRFLCRPGRWSTRLKLQRPPEGSAQVDGNVAKIDLAARGVDGLVHFNAPSWAVRAVMSSTTLPVCPKTGSTSPSLTVHLCLHTALLREIGNAPSGGAGSATRARSLLASASCPVRACASSLVIALPDTRAPRPAWRPTSTRGRGWSRLGTRGARYVASTASERGKSIG